MRSFMAGLVGTALASTVLALIFAMPSGTQSTVSAEEPDLQESGPPIARVIGLGRAAVAKSGYAVSVRAQDPRTGEVVNVPVELRVVADERLPRPRLLPSGEMVQGYEGAITIEATVGGPYVRDSQGWDGSYGIKARNVLYYYLDGQGGVRISWMYGQWRRTDPNLNLLSARLWGHCFGVFASGGRCWQESSRWLNPPSTPVMGTTSWGPAYWHSTPWSDKYVIPGLFGHHCAKTQSEIYWTNPNSSWELTVGTCFYGT